MDSFLDEKLEWFDEDKAEEELEGWFEDFTDAIADEDSEDEDSEDDDY